MRTEQLCFFICFCQLFDLTLRYGSCVGVFLIEFNMEAIKKNSI
jgi:hypothetical protein